MNKNKFFVLDEEDSSRDEQKIYPVESNDYVGFYIVDAGNKKNYKWCDVTGKEPEPIMEIEESRIIRTILFQEDFAIISQQKVQGLPKIACYRLVIRDEAGIYQDVTKQLCNDYDKICKGNRCVITSVTRTGDIYELHFRAKGFDRSQCFQKNGGKLSKISDVRARVAARTFRFNEKAERLCKSIGKPMIL